MPKKKYKTASFLDINVHELNKQIGARMRWHRISRGQTQSDIAKRIGITFQQMQKYEKGSNRIPQATLFYLAYYWGISIKDFFPDPKDTFYNTRRSPRSKNALNFEYMVGLCNVDPELQDRFIKLFKRIHKKLISTQTSKT